MTVHHLHGSLPLNTTSLAAALHLCARQGPAPHILVLPLWPAALQWEPLVQKAMFSRCPGRQFTLRLQGAACSALGLQGAPLLRTRRPSEQNCSCIFEGGLVISLNVSQKLSFTMSEFCSQEAPGLVTAEADKVLR